MPFHKFFTVCAICLTTFTLAGCSGEPSESDIEDAVKANVAQVNTTVKNVGGGLIGDSMQTQVHGVKKIACAKASEDAGYNCDVELDITAPIVGRSKNVGKIRLVEGDSGWAVTE